MSDCTVYVEKLFVIQFRSEIPRLYGTRNIITAIREVTTGHQPAPVHNSMREDLLICL
jgi:hypothetical protein